MISVIIPVYKNRELFLKFMGHNWPYLQKTEIIIVNDDPADNLTTLVHKISPKIKVINNQKNLGFGQSVNLGAKTAKGEFLFLLNSDVLLNDNKFLHTISEFKNKALFALSFAQLNHGNLTSPNGGHFSKGLFQHYALSGHEQKETLWPEGGSSLIRKEYFLKLKGFSDLYSPFYWEDVDLGYRARRAGFISLYYPKVVLVHNHSTTIGKYHSKESVQTINYRNQIMFVWNNIRGINLLVHFLYLPILILKNRRNPLFIKGLWLAIRRFIFKHE